MAAPLAAYLALLHVAGPMAKEDPPLEAVDPWTVWRCASEPLRAVLRRDGGRIVPPEAGHGASAAGRVAPMKHRRRPLSSLRGARLVWPRPGGSSRSKMTTSAASASSASDDPAKEPRCMLCH